METENILDVDLNSAVNKPFFEVIEWWENKRLMYNFFVVGIQVAMMIKYWRGVQIFGIEDAIFSSIAYAIVANILFSLGWGIELLIMYYFKKNKFFGKNRVVSLILGIIFSIGLTIYSYQDVLIPLHLYSIF